VDPTVAEQRNGPSHWEGPFVAVCRVRG